MSITGLNVANGSVTGDESGPLSLGGGGILVKAGASLTLKQVVVAGKRKGKRKGVRLKSPDSA